jgi:hypothetical protein
LIEAGFVAHDGRLSRKRGVVPVAGAPHKQRLCLSQRDVSAGYGQQTANEKGQNIFP